MIIQTQDDGSVIYVDKGQLVATAKKSKWKKDTWELELINPDWSIPCVESIYEIDSLEEGEKLLLE